MTEIDTLRGDDDNPHAKKLFAGMSPSEIAEAIAAVTRVPDAAVRRVVKENGGGEGLADKLIARKADMAKRLEG